MVIGGMVYDIILATFVFLVHVLADAIWCLGRPLWWIAENDMGFVRKTDVKRHRYYRYDMYENQDMFHVNNVFTKCYLHVKYTSSLRKPLRLPTKITKNAEVGIKTGLQLRIPIKIVVPPIAGWLKVATAH